MYKFFNLIKYSNINLLTNYNKIKNFYTKKCIEKINVLNAKEKEKVVIFEIVNEDKRKNEILNA